MTAVRQEPDPPAQDDLADRFRAGDETALREAYDRYGRAVLHLATSTLANRSDAEDVTQATFVAAWLGRETFDPTKGSLIGWLLGIGRRKVIDRLRASARETRVVETVRQLPEPTTTGPDRTRWSTGWWSPTSWPACRTTSDACWSWRSTTT